MSWISVLHTYRFDVYLLFVAVTTAFWFFLPSSTVYGIDERVIVAFCFLLGLIWIYLFNKTQDREEDAISQPKEMLSQAEDRVVRKILPILIILPIVILWHIQMPIWPFLFYILLGFLYSYPVYKKYRVKNVPVLKTLWAAADLLSPLFFGFAVYFVPENIIPYIVGLFAYSLIYMTGELIWDIRDVEGDRASGVRTIPVVFGLTVTKIICVVMTVAGALILSPNWATLVIAGFVITVALVARPDSNRVLFHILLYVISAVIFVDLWIKHVL